MTKFAEGESGASVRAKINATIEAVDSGQSDWNAAYGWGDHSTAGYLTLVSPTDVESVGVAAGFVLTADGAGGAAWEDASGEIQDGDTVSSLDINGGTIDGTVIGGTTPAAGTFTTLQSDDGEAYAPENILGTVSESSGTPTGAIIERGSNANGEYVKFADGTMICTGSGATQTTDAAWSGAIYINDPGLTISFPATFIAAPYVACTRADDTVSQGWAKATGIGTTGFSSFHFSASSTSTGRSEFIAVGRWF